MDNARIAQELVRIAKSLVGERGDTIVETTNGDILEFELDDDVRTIDQKYVRDDGTVIDGPKRLKEIKPTRLKKGMVFKTTKYDRTVYYTVKSVSVSRPTKSDITKIDKDIISYLRKNPYSSVLQVARGIDLMYRGLPDDEYAKARLMALIKKGIVTTDVEVSYDTKNVGNRKIHMKRTKAEYLLV